MNPFVDAGVGESMNDVVPVDTCNLVSYLVLQTYFIVSEQLKDCKLTISSYVATWEMDTKM